MKDASRKIPILIVTDSAASSAPPCGAVGS